MLFSTPDPYLMSWSLICVNCLGHLFMLTQLYHIDKIDLIDEHTHMNTYEVNNIVVGEHCQPDADEKTAVAYLYF